ncbi:MAG: hypothetical protein QOC82_2149 [Frankiaceae bacterium]|jgi:hypothetical protein|nr:hypothetical protein [Frankiaceae bacterium]
MMLALSRRTVIATSILAATGVAVPVTLAATSGGGTPANKAVAAGSHLAVISANQTQTLLTATFKTSKPEDLLLSVSAECSILTQLVTNNDNPSADAQAGVHMWLTLDGKVIPVQDASTPPQDPNASAAGDPAKDGVTFCDREYQRTVTDNESPADGIDTISDYIRTKSAHAFSWVRLNAGSGDHTVALVATFNNSTSGDPGNVAQAIIGNRTLIIEPTKLANNAVISDNGTSTSG